MAKFDISQVNPYKYKNEIITLWRNNLPGTPERRLDWMENNPEGKAIWYLATDKTTKKIAGAISIMPRRVRTKAKTYLTGIVGDFMVQKEYQVFGPALQLLKTTVRDHPKLGFDFLYTFPNQAAEKIALRAGFQNIGLVSRFAMPLRIKHQLKKYIPSNFVKLIAPGLELGLRLFSNDIYIRPNGSFLEIEQFSPDFDLFFKEIENLWSALGERSTKYLNWKYFRNPLYRFRVFTYNRCLDNTIQGYLIFTVQNNDAHIFDILVSQEKILRGLLAQFMKIARKSGYFSVSIRVLQNNPLLRDIKSFGFFDRTQDVPLLFAGNPALAPQGWVFFDGDRNI